MEERVKKGFTTISRWLVIIIAIFSTSSCNDELREDQIPLAAFDDIFINLNLPQFNALTIDGNFITLNQGVRGIILYRQNSNTYFAFERNCTFLPNEAASTVNVDQSSLFMRDTSCGSIFSFNEGVPTSGPARFPLRQYTVIQDGRTLTITDEPIN